MIKAILAFPILLLSLYGMGEWLRFRFLGNEPMSAGRIGRAFGFGILAHALLMTFLGFTFLLRPIIAGLITAIPALIFARIWGRDIGVLCKQANWKTSVRFTVQEIILILIIIAMSLLRGFNALAPNISWDATSHHYLVPDIWLRSGLVSDIPSVIFSYYPSLTEIGIAGTMALGSDFLSNLYGWLFGVIATLLLIGIPFRHFNSAPIQID